MEHQLKRLKIAVLVSGRGSNLQSLIDACADKNFPAEIGLVISNIDNVFALERAQQSHIPTTVIDHKKYTTREEFEMSLQKELETAEIQLVCLAGFMRVLTPIFVDQWVGRLINIHPSLLPKFKGLHTHERALEAGETESGCTVHFVTSELDDGPIIIQKRVPVLENDTPDTLAARILIQEHIAYPEALRLIAPKILSLGASKATLQKPTLSI